MAFEWSPIITKAFDQAKVFVPAAGFTGLVIMLAPTSWGLLTSTGEIVWLPVMTIFCLISGGMMLILHYFVGTMHFVTGLAAVPLRRRRAIAKMPALSSIQREYLFYIKLRDLDQFQAWERDDIVASLESMGLIEKHEWTTPYYARYTVPRIIWRRLADPDEKQTAYLDRKYERSPPWDPERHSGRL